MNEWELMIQAEMHDNGLIGYDWLGNSQISKWHQKQIATNRTNCQLNATYASIKFCHCIANGSIDRHRKGEKAMEITDRKLYVYPSASFTP